MTSSRFSVKPLKKIERSVLSAICLVTSALIISCNVSSGDRSSHGSSTSSENASALTSFSSEEGLGGFAGDYQNPDAPYVPEEYVLDAAGSYGATSSSRTPQAPTSHTHTTHKLYDEHCKDLKALHKGVSSLALGGFNHCIPYGTQLKTTSFKHKLPAMSSRNQVDVVWYLDNTGTDMAKHIEKAKNILKSYARYLSSPMGGIDTKIYIISCLVGQSESSEWKSYVQSGQASCVDLNDQTWKELSDDPNITFLHKEFSGRGYDVAGTSGTSMAEDLMWMSTHDIDTLTLKSGQQTLSSVSTVGGLSDGDLAQVTTAKPTAQSSKDYLYLYESGTQSQKFKLNEALDNSKTGRSDAKKVFVIVSDKHANPYTDTGSTTNGLYEGFIRNINKTFQKKNVAFFSFSALLPEDRSHVKFPASFNNGEREKFIREHVETVPRYFLGTKGFKRLAFELSSNSKSSCAKGYSQVYDHLSYYYGGVVGAKLGTSQHATEYSYTANICDADWKLAFSIKLFLQTKKLAASTIVGGDEIPWRLAGNGQLKGKIFLERFVSIKMPNHTMLKSYHQFDQFGHRPPSLLIHKEYKGNSTYQGTPEVEGKVRYFFPKHSSPLPTAGQKASPAHPH